jgi:outer membrane protein TolC
MLVKRISIFTALLLFVVHLNGQPIIDSTKVFTVEEFMGWITEHHPVAKQAVLLDQQAQALLRQARGGFDPKAYADWDQKSFDRKDYFAIGEGGFKIPTWYGIELKAAYEITDGIYLNPERNLPESGQAILGITMPIGRDLVIDNRRAALQQAKLMSTANSIEQQRILNNLLLEGITAYWNWTLAYNQLKVYERALNLVQQRQEGIVESFLQGDKPALDTLETAIQIQNRQLELTQAQLEFINAGLTLSNFLWYEGHLPLELTQQLVPPMLDVVAYVINELNPQTIWQQASQLHPDLRKYEIKREQLEVDRRLAVEQLKPQLDLSYNFLGDGANFVYGNQQGDSDINTLFTQNLKWGLDFEMPLFLRKERGKVQLTELKIQENELQFQQKRTEVENKIFSYYNSLSLLLDQINISTIAVENYQALLDAELLKFNLGESSIFLINSREQKLLEAELKLVSLRAKFQKDRQALSWAAGQLAN